MNPGLQGGGRKGRVGRSIVFAIILLLGLLLLRTFSGRRLGFAQGRAAMSLQVGSSSFSNGGAIPRQYTCDGAGISPSLKWTATPARTKSFAIVMHDPDALLDFTHWLAYNIPPDAHELTEGASARGTMPHGSAEGSNSFGRPGYGGPCPPAGKLHHYVFDLYGLDTRLDLLPGAARDRLEAAMKQHVVAQGQIIGVYER